MSRDDVMKLVELIKKTANASKKNDISVTSVQYDALAREIKRKPSRIKYGHTKKDHIMLDNVRITIVAKG